MDGICRRPFQGIDVVGQQGPQLLSASADGTQMPGTSLSSNGVPLMSFGTSGRRLAGISTGLWPIVAADGPVGTPDPSGE